MAPIWDGTGTKAIAIPKQSRNRAYRIGHLAITHTDVQVSYLACAECGNCSTVTWRSARNRGDDRRLSHCALKTERDLMRHRQHGTGTLAAERVMVGRRPSGRRQSAQGSISAGLIDD